MVELIYNVSVLFTTLCSPYPYMLLFAVLLWLLLFFVAFFDIKNGKAGWMCAAMCFISLTTGLCIVGQPVLTPDGSDMDGERLEVRRVDRYGLYLSNGEYVMPAGVEFTENRYMRRQAIREISIMTNGGQVRLNYERRLRGYEVYTHNDVNIAHYLLSEGLAMTSDNASDAMYDLESKAREERKGCWAVAGMAQSGISRNTDLLLRGLTTMLSCALLIIMASFLCSAYLNGVDDELKNKMVVCVRTDCPVSSDSLDGGPVGLSGGDAGDVRGEDRGAV